MRTRLFALLIVIVTAVSTFGARASNGIHLENAGVTAEITPDGVSLSNGIVQRTWLPDALKTAHVGRIGREFSESHDDFALQLDGPRVPSGVLPIVNVATTIVPGGVRITWTLGAPAGLQVTRTVEAYGGIAGFKSQTTVSSLAPVVLSGYTLDEVSLARAESHRAAATVHAFRAGADWREPDWSPPSIGDPHTGDWRMESSNDGWSSVSAPGEWLSINADGDQVAIVSERRDYASSRMTFTGVASDALVGTSVGKAEVDFSRDVVYIGPFEESAHAENPGPGPARHRVITPGAPLVLEPAFTMFPADADDEGWQFTKYLTQHRNGGYEKRVMFNSDGVDTNAISTGAKDDMNYERFLQILPAVREMGADTFIFDDGWMARSGDWCPDSPECPEPRWDGVPGSKFRPRFPDAHFDAVREQLAGDPHDPSDDIKLGLWMNPMEFNPSSAAFQMNPQWACAPVGDALAVYNVVEPNSSSNEAGLGVWNPVALGVDPTDDDGEVVTMIEYMRKRIEYAIVDYGATYFKFDFLAWVDCGGAYPVDMYGYHDAFVDMIDTIQAAHPDVSMSIDETNDYRMFPFESTARGPAWFQNGSPSNATLLHNVWALSPFIPGYSLGQRTFANAGDRAKGIDTVMASSLLGHLTFSMPVDTSLTAADREKTRKWVDFYHDHSDTLAGMTYPLLEDPNELDWTALQSWDGDDASGWLLAFRQDGADSSRSIALRGLARVDPETAYHVTRVDPATGTSLVEVMTASALAGGLAVTIAERNGYAIFRVERA